MLFRTPPEVLLLLVPVLIFALCFHEFAHAWVAYKLGDPTAKQSGRLTLNPLAHLDPMGSLMILIIGFGYAKPVPVDARYLKNPRTDMMKVAFAGPAANLLLAFVGGTIIRAHIVGGSLILMLYLFTQINIMLAVFNMIPVPPLDGSKIFGNIIAKNNPVIASKMFMYGPKILMGLILIGILTPFSILGSIMMPFIKFFLYLFTGI